MYMQRMGSIIAVLVAFISIQYNDNLFKIGTGKMPGPLVSSYMFLISVFLLLQEFPLYPNSLRRLGFISQGIIEVLVAGFIVEALIVGFWLPLEGATMESLPKLADAIEDYLSCEDRTCGYLCEALRGTSSQYIASYLLSSFFLLTVLHATRSIDLRTLDGGLGCFFNNIICRIKRCAKKQFRSFFVNKSLFAKKEPKIVPIKDVDEMYRAYPCAGASMSDNRLNEEKKMLSKKRTRRNTVPTPRAYKDTNNKRNPFESERRQTRSSTCCADNA